MGRTSMSHMSIHEPTPYGCAMTTRQVRRTEEPPTPPTEVESTEVGQVTRTFDCPSLVPQVFRVRTFRSLSTSGMREMREIRQSLASDRGESHIHTTKGPLFRGEPKRAPLVFLVSGRSMKSHPTWPGPRRLRSGQVYLVGSVVECLCL